MFNRTRRYVPHIPSMQAIGEMNYSKLLKILPDCDTEDLSYQFSVGKHLCYRVKIVDSARYTSTLVVEQINHNSPAFLKPVMTVRMYHDVRVAEVLNSQNTGAFAPSYQYPNSKMRARNEKQMVNVFLAEWLQFCSKHRPSVTSSV